ncbi:hypothetical protein EDB19DRAFT_1917158 [Suillus lakei]|nr:hypothetical protein EDB19DRAFT_1922003 [Suillus lakei]KAG1721674.1 hypothetical protein EDB19DRAFT_1917158 [Suillus lakei]
MSATSSLEISLGGICCHILALPELSQPLPVQRSDLDASAIEGLLFEYSQVQPEGPHMSGGNVDLGDPGNLVPEYDSADDMDVEVKVEVSCEEVDMAT